jgi:hypothetical protein
MSETHTYPTVTIPARDLDYTHVIVGESGGLCAVYESAQPSPTFGLYRVETEHGHIFIDPAKDVNVLAPVDA